MARPVFCEFCDYALVGLITEGGSAICPECGRKVLGRWFPRRVRVGLAVLAAISPVLICMIVFYASGLLRSIHAGGWSAFEIVVAVLGLAAIFLPPGAAWWLWKQSARRATDLVDIMLLVPVGWVLNSVCIIAGAGVLL